MHIGQLIHQSDLTAGLPVKILCHLLNKSLNGVQIPLPCLQVHACHHIFKIMAKSADLRLNLFHLFDIGALLHQADLLLQNALLLLLIPALIDQDQMKHQKQAYGKQKILLPLSPFGRQQPQNEMKKHRIQAEQKQNPLFALLSFCPVPVRPSGPANKKQAEKPAGRQNHQKPEQITPAFLRHAQMKEFTVNERLCQQFAVGIQNCPKKDGAPAGHQGKSVQIMDKDRPGSQHKVFPQDLSDLEPDLPESGQITDRPRHRKQNSQNHGPNRMLLYRFVPAVRHTPKKDADHTQHKYDVVNHTAQVCAGNFPKGHAIFLFHCYLKSLHHFTTVLCASQDIGKSLPKNSQDKNGITWYTFYNKRQDRQFHTLTLW